MPSAATELQFRIHGMDCAEEIAVLKREVAPRVGGEDRRRLHDGGGVAAAALFQGPTGPSKRWAMSRSKR